MSTLRTHVVMPVKLAKEIDAVAGPRGRSAFLVETAEREIKRLKLLKFLKDDTPAWSAENHPDIEELGSAEWVRRMRNESSPRKERLEQMLNEGVTDASCPVESVAR